MARVTVQPLHGARLVAEGAALRAFEHIRLTRAQEAFLADDRQFVLCRGGNQIGKTTALLLDLIARCRGVHPWQSLRHKPPINVVVISESWDQMGQVGGFMQKLWELLPKDEIDPKNDYEPGRGITGKPPRIRFVSGPGKGSAITFATYRQGAKRVAGSTVHHVLMDEPGPESLFVEMLPRLFRYGGTMRLNFTPVLDMPDQTELRKRVASGRIHEHNPRLLEANCWPQGAPRPWKTQRELDQLIAVWPQAVLPMRVLGAWDPVYTGNALSAFDATLHVREDAPATGALLGVGVDHGAQAGKQAAVLGALSSGDEPDPYAWLMDEEIGDGRTSTREDARSILAMLRRNGQSWRDVDVWVGDRPTTADRRLIVKDNRKLRAALADEVGVPLEQFPEIQTARKGPGSLDDGLTRWNKLLALRDGDGAPHFLFHPRCAQTIKFASQWDGRDIKSPLKNPGDATRYWLDASIVAAGGTPSAVLKW